MKRLVLVVMAVAVGASVAWASCIHPPATVYAELGKSAAVFAGEVLARRDSFAVDTALSRRMGETAGTDWGSIVDVKVLRSWKGPRADSVVTVVAQPGGGHPKYPFVVGERYLIYAHMIDSSWGGWYAGWGGRALVTGECARTRALWKAAADLRQLGLAASDSEWLRKAAANGRDSTEIIPLADSLANLRTPARHRRKETGTASGQKGTPKK